LVAINQFNFILIVSDELHEATLQWYTGLICQGQLMSDLHNALTIATMIAQTAIQFTNLLIIVDFVSLIPNL
jgi:ABC-type spermidine/putrescine transport system permease subunit II